MSSVFTNSALNCKLRILEAEGQLLFYAKDIAEYLDYSESSNIRRILDEDEWFNFQDITLSCSHHDSKEIEGLRSTSLFITESGLYHAIFKSTKDDAKNFRRWVTKEVLPSIRKTGSYSVSKKIELLEKETKAQQAQINELTTEKIKDKHYRVPAVEIDENGETSFTQKDRRVVNERDVLLGRYAMQACGISKTISILKEFGYNLPPNIKLKGGRTLECVYREKAIDAKLSTRDVRKLFRKKNVRTLFNT